MAYQEINRSTQANDGAGDDARTWASKTNANMKELFSRSFILNDWIVTRWTFDPNDLKFAEFLDGDRIEGWEDGAKTHYVAGILKDVSALAEIDDITAAEIDDPDLFFKITNLYDV